MSVTKPHIETLVGHVMDVVKVGLYPIVGAEVLEDAHVFDAARDIQGQTVGIYPPDVVLVKRVIDHGRHLIARYAGGPLCVFPMTCLKPSEVRLS